MIGYDKNVPVTLKNVQDWFASIITMPIDDESRMNPASPWGTLMVEEAQKYIAPSPTLEPDQRIQIYNQQYWWRLLSTLHDNFPLTTRLFGYQQFNSLIGTPYLQKYPSTHWSLNHLGDKLPQWVREEYYEEDKPLVVEAIDTDQAFNNSFSAGEYPFMDLYHDTKDSSKTAILKEKMRLQPHVHMFSFQHNLLPFRKVMLKEEPEFWEEHPFPSLEKEKTYYFVLYRNRHCQVTWTEINQYEYKLLENFKSGSTIEHACHWLEHQDQQFLEEASENLHLWFQEWTLRHWLCKSQ
jgi:hypothetical protein